MEWWRDGWTRLAGPQVATDSRRIFEAWSDERWVTGGASVLVSLVCFSATDDESVSGARLDGQSVDEICTDLTARRRRRRPHCMVHYFGAAESDAVASPPTSTPC